MEEDNDSLSETEDEVVDLEKIRDQIHSTPKSDRMQVSAWDDDDSNIDVELDAKEPDAKACLSAAEEGNINKIIRLIEKNRDLLKCTDKDGYTPLHRACYGNHLHVIEYLLKSGAELDAKTQDDWQPLHSAACWNNVDSAALLIENGADINAKSKGEQTPLHLVCSQSQNSAALQLFLLNPDTDPTVINSSSDTPQMICRRSGVYHPIFEITEPCLNDIYGSVTD